jgi:hypothetical protein
LVATPAFLLALPEVQALQYLPDSVDVGLETADAASRFRGQEGRFGDSADDIDLAFFGDLHGVEELPDHNVAVGREDDVFWGDVEVCDCRLLQFGEDEAKLFGDTLLWVVREVLCRKVRVLGPSSSTSAREVPSR